MNKKIQNEPIGMFASVEERKWEWSFLIKEILWGKRERKETSD